MAQNVTQYCHVCKSQTTSGPPVKTPEISVGIQMERSVLVSTGSVISGLALSGLKLYRG